MAESTATVPSRAQRQQARSPRRQQPSEELRHGKQVDQRAEAVGHRHAESAADEHDRASSPRRTGRRIDPRVAPTAFRTPISRVRSRTATSITFITPMPPRNRSPRRPRPGSTSCHRSWCGTPWCLPPCPRYGRPLRRADRSREDVPARAAPRTCRPRRHSSDLGVTSSRSTRAALRWRLVREIPEHGAEGDEHLRDVAAVVARVLLLLPSSRRRSCKGCPPT